MAPFVLTPSTLPRREFDKSVRLQPVLNELTHKVAYDEEFLRETLAETIKVDEFTRKLFEIYDKVWKDEKTQACILSCCVRRYTVCMFNYSPCASYHVCITHQLNIRDYPPLKHTLLEFHNPIRYSLLPSSAHFIIILPTPTINTQSILSIPMTNRTPIIQ